MKLLVKLVAVFAVIVGAVYLAFKGIEKQKDKKKKTDNTPDVNEQYVPLSDEIPKPTGTSDDSKSASIDNIGVRHQSAAAEMKESLDSILETSVPESENNEARLGQIFEDLEEI